MVIRIGQRPGKFQHDIGLLHQCALDRIGILFEHEYGWNSDIVSTAVICHDRLMFFALRVGIRCAKVFVFALANIIRNDNRYGSSMLTVADFLDKGTAAAIDHEDEGGFPVWWGDERCTEVEICTSVLNVLLDGSAIRWDAEEGLVVVITAPQIFW